MKLTAISLLALGASAVSARFVEKHEIDQVAINGHQDAEELYTIELAPGEVKKVTEDEKWEFRRVCLYSLVHHLLRISIFPCVSSRQYSYTDNITARNQFHGHLGHR